jgi:hypothetical protein
MYNVDSTKRLDSLLPYTLNRYTNISSYTMVIILILSQYACQSIHARISKHNSSVEILNQHNQRLPAFRHQQKYYVMGSYGEAYKIRVYNNSNTRVEAVVTVDGRDVINGKSGSFKHRGYVIDSGGYVDIKGFRQSTSHVATFRFTQLYDSYAARRGSPQNIGVIGVALFQEKLQATALIATPRKNEDDEFPVWNESLRNPKGVTPHVSRPYPSHSHKKQGASSVKSEMNDSSSLSTTKSLRPSKKSSAYRGRRPHHDKIGTRYGERRYDQAIRSTFVRNSEQPSRVIRIDYDNEAGLRRRGIIINQAYPQEANPFPQAEEFASPP